MVIRDSGRTVTLDFSEVEIGSFPADLFDREKMGGGVTRAKTKRNR